MHSSLGPSLFDALQATLGHIYNTTEEAISSPLPSQDDSVGAYSPEAPRDLLHGHLALPSHTLPHHVTDYSSLYNSPAGTGTEILVLEGQDGSHVNLTQSRFSRYASETNGSLNPFQATSQVFRSSATDQAWHLSGHKAASVQLALTAHGHGQESVSAPAYADSPDTDSVAFWQTGDVVADTPAQAAGDPESMSKYQSPAASHGSLHMSSQASARLSSISRAAVQQVSSSRKVRSSSLEIMSPGRPEGSAGISARASFARSSSRLPASPSLGDYTQQNGNSPSNHYGDQIIDHFQQMHENWDSQSLSNTGSMHSPEHESTHSQVASTPAKAEPTSEAGTPDHRKLASSIARLASAAALARSPGLANVGASSNLKTQLSDRMSNPEMRTPRTFFNPSFDETQSP